MKSMTILLLILSTIISTQSLADFNLGMEYYSKRDYAKAFKEFDEAAKNGDYDAQFNVGVMHLKGEHTTKNAPMAYAWLRLAAQAKVYEDKGVYKKVYAKLNDSEKKLADSLYEETEREYNDLAVFTTTELKKHRIIRTVTPTYPKHAKADVGWVDIIFSIDKDGTTRDHIAFFSSDKAFEKKALEGIRGFLFEPSVVNTKPVTVNGLRYRFTFIMSGIKYNEKAINETLSTLRTNAQKGIASDIFNYAYFIEALPSLTRTVKIEDNPNDWYLTAANKGSSPASFFLGKNLLNGNMCEVDGTKSTSWLVKASQGNLSEAQYLLAIESFSGARIEKNEEKGLYWLKRSAENSDVAKLRLAWILSTHNNKNHRDNNLATEYFNKVSKDHTDRQTYFRTAAAIAANNNDFKQAIKWQKKAIDDAEDLELPLDTVNAQLTSYQEGKPWHEEP
jgi:uncharacterized protein